MTNILLVGAGESGTKLARALVGLGRAQQLTISDADFDRARLLGSTMQALAVPMPHALRIQPYDLIILATPPTETVSLMHQLLPTSSVILVEKPGALDPHDVRTWLRLSPPQRVFVAFQTHFTAKSRLIIDNPDLTTQRACFRIGLQWRRDPPYFMGWRGDRALAGGILHQHVIHSLAMALRSIPTDDQTTKIVAATWRLRGGKTVEDDLRANIRFTSGRVIEIEATIAAPTQGEHSLKVNGDQARFRVSGENLEAGVQRYRPTSHHWTPPSPRSKDELRERMIASVLRFVETGELDVRLYDVERLPRVLSLIADIYAVARHHDNYNN